MTKLEFMAACGEYCVDPEIALENEDLLDALCKRDDDKVVELLKTQF